MPSFNVTLGACKGPYGVRGHFKSQPCYNQYIRVLGSCDTV